MGDEDKQFDATPQKLQRARKIIEKLWRKLLN